MRRTPCCSVPPGPARPRPWPGSPSGAAAGAGDGAQQDARRPARQRVPRDASATTPSSTSSPTTTTTSPKRTSRRPTPTSRRTPRSTRRWTGCGTRPPTSLLTRRDVIIVASVSCIYGLGTPQEYVDRMVSCRLGDTLDRDELLRRLVDMQYERNDLAFTRGTFRVRGDTVEIIPAYEELAVRVEMFGDEVERLIDPAPAHRRGDQRGRRAVRLPGHPLRRRPGADGARPSPASRRSWTSGSPSSSAQGKLLEAQRLRMRTTYDLEMMREVGYCSGIENYSPPHRRPRAGHARRTPCSTTSPRTSCWSSTSRTSPSRRSAACTTATCPQADAGRARLPPAVSAMDNRPLTLRRVRRADRPDDLPVGHPGAVRAAAGAARWSSR